ncbi:MAG: sulfur carrier protein ThiS [Alphaproteobacteria bacterium]
MGQTITVSGEPHRWHAQTVRELLAECGIDPDRHGVAVAVNANVVPRGAWRSIRLAPDDRVEIVAPRAGG